MKNIFITGATSFIGVNLIKELIKSKNNIIAIIRNNSKHKDLLSEFNNIKIVELDMEEIERLPELINIDCDVFYHLAWNGTRGALRDDKSIQTDNYNNSINALNTAQKMGCKIFFSAGSQAEYGVNSGLISEDVKEAPVTEYGINKLKFCNYAKEYCKNHNITFIEPRFFSLYGIGDYENSLINSCINKMLNNEDIDLTKCIQTWNYLNVKDAVKALVLLQNNNKSGVYNVASSDTRILKDFIDDIYSVTKSKSKLNYGAIPYPSTGIVTINPSIDKIKSETNWKTEVTFIDGIKEIIETRSK